VLAESLRRAKSILTHNGFHFVVLTVAILVFVCAGLVRLAERHTRGANERTFKTEQCLDRIEHSWRDWWAVATVAAP
jgi:hypothetical protein